MKHTQLVFFIGLWGIFYALTSIWTSDSPFIASQHRGAFNPLVTGQNNCHVSRDMKRWSSRRILILVFGLLLAGGTVVSAMQTGDMAFDMTTSGCVDTAGAICCDNCSGGNDEDTSGNNCLPTCTSGTYGVIPSGVTLEMADQQQMLISTPTGLPGRVSLPDPYPPRTTDLI